MSNHEGRPQSPDIQELKSGISSLDPGDQKYIVIDVLRNLSSKADPYDTGGDQAESIDPQSIHRDLADVAYEAMQKVSGPDKFDLLTRLGLSDIPGPDMTAQENMRKLDAKIQSEYWTVRQQRLIALGVLSVFILITLAFVVAVALQLEGASQLGTAFTTLLGAVTGFYAGRRQGETGDLGSDQHATPEKEAEKE